MCHNVSSLLKFSADYITVILNLKQEYLKEITMKKGILYFFLACLLSNTIFAASKYGFNFSYPLKSTEPTNVHGAQLYFIYDPDRFKWRKFNVFFDLGVSYFTTNNTPYHTSMNIYSIAPVVRYTFRQNKSVSPYFDLSIGLSYLNHTRFENRNLGIHFAFQDRAGLGVLLGQKKQFNIGLHAVHYSNAHFSNHNSGITVPLMLDIGYRFG
jgi:lipid A 3-O-deacylase